MNTHENITQYVDRHGISVEKAQLEDSNPHREDDEWSRSATHYFVTLASEVQGQNRKMDVHWSQGPAVDGEPTAEDVLNALASDVSSVEEAQGDWIYWAKAMGYESIEDADKARVAYQEIIKQRDRLLWLLGSRVELEALLYGTERL